MFAEPFRLLQQEAYLIRSCFSLGLTTLRRADLNEVGLFYAAFFHLSTGIERMAKVTLIVNHMRKHDMVCPETSDLKKYGHRLVDLMNQCEQVAKEVGTKSELVYPDEEVKGEVLSILDGYANGLRYYNLDTLRGNAGSQDPLARWYSLLLRVLSTDVGASRRKQIAANVESLKDAFGDSTISFVHGLDGRLLDLNEVATIPALIDAATPHAIWHIIGILKDLLRVHCLIAELARKKQQELGISRLMVPFMEEFYYFLDGDRAYHLKKKRWP